MRIITSLLPRTQSPTSDAPADVAVVIDVLRATSVMSTAAASGADRVITCREVSEAFALASQLSPRPLLCGERGCKPIQGFDLGNSPAEYGRERVESRTLILTTTNGTKAIERASSAKRMLAASFLNLDAVVHALANCELVHLACAGTDGDVTAEDVLLAGAIIDQCHAHYGAVTINDESTLARELWHSWFPVAATHDLPSPSDLAKRLRETQGGRNLIRLGFEADLDRCAVLNQHDAVLERDGRDPTSFRLLAR
ncbi:MAG: 2-phosphosulfolactate phosphatase [Rubripirellula sp.]